MRALVSGGAGFLGSHLCERLLAEGWEVVAIDDLSTGLRPNVEHLTPDPAFTFLVADVTRDPLPDEPVDAVLHLASPASPVQYRRLALETLLVNSTGTWRLLDLAARQGARFLLASTSEVYGDPMVHPQTEDYWGNVDPIGPRSMYDEGKRFAEALSTWFSHRRGLDVRIARIFNTYGPRMDLWDGRVVCTFVRQALAGEPLTVHGTGEQTRSFCYVSDLIDGLVRLSVAEPGEVNHAPVNLGNSAEMTVTELAEVVVRLAGSNSPIHHVEAQPSDPSRRRPDIGRAARVLDWRPAVSLEDGLRRTIEWARRSLEQLERSG